MRNLNHNNLYCPLDEKNVDFRKIKICFANNITKHIVIICSIFIKIYSKFEDAFNNAIFYNFFITNSQVILRNLKNNFSQKSQETEYKTSQSVFLDDRGTFSDHIQKSK
jgi:hypothetical protein